jgi:hypothetical protein
MRAWLEAKNASIWLGRALRTRMKQHLARFAGPPNGFPSLIIDMFDLVRLMVVTLIDGHGQLLT